MGNGIFFCSSLDATTEVKGWDFNLLKGAGAGAGANFCGVLSKMDKIQIFTYCSELASTILERSFEMS